MTTHENISVDPRSTTGKAAKKFKEALDSRSFSPEIFAYIMANGTPLEKEATMRVVKAFIACLADQYCIGEVNEVTLDAMRLHDTIQRYS